MRSEQHQRVFQALKTLRADIASGRVSPWPDQRPPVHDPLAELERLLAVFVTADRSTIARDLCPQALAAAFEQLRAIHREAMAQGDRVGKLFTKAFGELTSATAYDALLDAMLRAAQLSAGDSATKPWFVRPRLPSYDVEIQSIPALLRILERLLVAWDQWEALGLERSSLENLLDECMDAKLLWEWDDDPMETFLCRIERIRTAFDAREIAEPEPPNDTDKSDIWDTLWMHVRGTRDVELVREIQFRYVEYMGLYWSGQGYHETIALPGPHMPELLADYLTVYYQWDPELRDEDPDEFGLLEKFPDAVEIDRSSAHLAAGTRIALEALEIIERDFFKPGSLDFAFETLRCYLEQLGRVRPWLGPDLAATIDELERALLAFVPPRPEEEDELDDEDLDD